MSDRERLLLAVAFLLAIFDSFAVIMLGIALMTHLLGSKG